MPGTYDVQLTAVDNKSNAKSSLTFKLNVTSVAPTLSIPALAPISDGQSVTLVPTLSYVGNRNPNEKVTWSVVDPTGQVRSLTGREPKFTPETSGTWGAVVIVDDGFGNVVKSQTQFTVSNLAPTNLTATEGPAQDGSFLRTYSGSVKDFSADRLQGKLIVQNDNNGSRLETPIVLDKQGPVDNTGVQTYTFSASVVLTELVGNVVSIEVVDEDGATVTVRPTQAANSSEDYSNAVVIPPRDM